jgi:hypothetical protein
VKKNCLTDYTLKSQTEKLKTNFISDNCEVAKSSADKLGLIGCDEIVDFLIPFLSFENSGIRNRVTLLF